MSLPVVGQIALTFCLGWLILTSHQQSQENAHSSKVISLCNMLLQKNASVVFRIQLFHDDVVRRDAASLFNYGARLSQLVHGMPEQRDLLKQLKTYISDVYESSKPHGHAKNPYEEMGELSSITSQIIANERKRVPDTQPGNSENLILSALMLSVIISFLAAMLWSLRLRKDIAEIAANAERLGTRQPLTDAKLVTSELGALNNVLLKVDSIVRTTTEREHGLINNAAELICKMTREGIIKEANPFIRHMMGYLPSEIEGKSIFNFASPSSCIALENNLNEAITAGVSTSSNLKVLHKSGREIEVEAVIQSDSDRQELFCIMKDVTERNEVDRLKQDFLELVSHDLRSPLTSIQGSLTLLEAGACGDIPPEAAAEVEVAQRCVRNVIGLVNDLLDFEKLQAGQMPIALSAFDIRELAGRIVQDLLPLAKEHRVELVCDGSPLTVNADKDRIAQVMANLVTNAIHHSPEGGKVLIDWKRTGERATVSVSDQGKGVPAESREKIFMAFEQLAPNERGNRGTGLGLAICKLIIDSHPDCSIGVDSAAPGGSRFWFTLPA